MTWLAVLSPCARAQEGLDDLGIPMRAPWQVLGEEEKVSQSKVDVSRDIHPLEVRFWERIRWDLASLERWRSGLLDTLRFARSRPQVFAPEPSEKGLLFEEYRDIARESWERGLDYWLALETLVDRYSEFGELSGANERRAAFLVVYAAYLAQARFAREWSAMASHDPALGRLFNEAVPALGVPAGSYSLIRRRVSGSEFKSVFASMRSYYAHIGKGKALREIMGKKVSAWTRTRRSDARSLPGGRSSSRRSRLASLRVLRKRVYAQSFSIRSIARPWTSADEPPEGGRPYFFPPQPDWTNATISTRATYAVETLRHWFQVGPSTISRPAVLITKAQARALADTLLPGDILLIRRERFLGDIGLAGYWHHAGLYIGSKEERDDFFDEALAADLSKAYRKAAGLSEANPESKKTSETRYRKFLGRLKFWRPVEAEEPEKENIPQAKPDLPVVLDSNFEGVVLESLVRFAAADSLAVLRPRMDRGKRGEALLRALKWMGKPYDFTYDVRSDGVVASAELIYKAYGRDRAQREGLNLSLVDVNGRWSLSNNNIARKFDAEYGTDKQELDWILFLDGKEQIKKAASSSLEEFRRSWRRPKWVLDKEKGDEK